MPNINDYSDSTGFGEGSDRLKITKAGTLKLQGNATVWDDIQGNLIGRRLSSTTGKVDYNWTENTVTFQSGGSISNSADVVNFNLQIPHAAIEDGNIDLHMHWEQDTATPREITIKHRVQNNGSSKTTSWTTNVVSTDAYAKFTYTSGTINQISDLVDVDMTGIGISAIVEFQIARTDSEAGDMEVTFIDAHYEIDSLGSNTEYSKT